MMDFEDLQKACNQATLAPCGYRVVAFILPSPFGVDSDQRYLWPGGPRGWVTGMVSKMNLLVEFDADEVLSYLCECTCTPRLGDVRPATAEDYAFINRARP